VTATPIGNLGDITLRALAVLEGADAVLCEDTRVTAKLLSAYGIKAELVAYHDHNAARVRPRVLKRLAAGECIALVSDAGTPLISDPGYKLVAEARAAGASVHAVPGASSVPAALSVVGLPTDRFFFVGFLPPKAGARRKALEELKGARASLVLFEGPSRITALLRDSATVLGPRAAAVARELTKLHEEVRRGTLDELAAHYEAEGPPKGEIVVVIAPPTEDQGASIDVDEALRAALKTGSVKDAASEVAEMTGRPRREIYARALKIAKDRE
jgi:16S rRNA (cytidine1402-2'-O)-methyltransferase